MNVCATERRLEQVREETAETDRAASERIGSDRLRSIRSVFGDAVP